MTEGGRVCGCGQAVPAGRHGRWCSSWCEARERSGQPPQPPPGLVPSGRDAHPSSRMPASVARPARRSVAEQVTAALEAAGMSDSWLAAAALDLAGSIDDGGMSGSARAAVHRELRAIMAEALRGADAPGSAVGRYRDELAARRAARAGGAS